MGLEFLHGLMHTPAPEVDHFVASDTQTLGGGNSTVTTTHTLDGSGSDRAVLAFLSASAAGARTVNSVTLNGVAGTLIWSNEFGTPSDDMAHTAVAFWPDADHPGAGSFDVEFSYGNPVGTPIVTVVELKDIEQASDPVTRGIDGAEDISPNSMLLQPTTQDTSGGQVGDIMLNVLSGWDDAGFETAAEFACSDIDREINDLVNAGVIQGLWMDDSVASDPITYDITGSNSAQVAEAFQARSIVVRPAGT